MAYAAWTEDDDQFVVDNYQKMNDPQLAAALNRGITAIASRKTFLRKQGKIGYVPQFRGARGAHPKETPATRAKVEPCPPHHWICGNTAISEKYPGFFVGHERTEPGSGQEWQVCAKCSLVRLNQYDEALGHARQLPAVSDHYYTEKASTTVMSTIKLPVTISTGELKLISEASEPEPIDITQRRADQGKCSPVEDLEIGSWPQPIVEASVTVCEPREHEILGRKRQRLVDEVKDLRASLERREHELAIVNLQIENCELRAELQRLRAGRSAS